jgi:hypothetical protein
MEANDMRVALYRPLLLASVMGLVLVISRAQAWDGHPARAEPVARQSAAPVLQNPGFECTEGYHPQTGILGLVPDGWTAIMLAGTPSVNSTRMVFAGGCEEEGFVERLEGLDSLVVLSQDIETPPEPGKPFDAAIYQQVQVEPGLAYSLSGWMVSLCGGSFSNPNDCPAGYYMAKLLGIDPTGGVDPQASTVIWAEDRRNFTESRWANLRLAAAAEGSVLTVFVRVDSPFRWHGNHAFADAISIVRAPTAHFVDLPPDVTGIQTLVRWEGDLGPDIAAIPGGTYQLVYDIQYRDSTAGEWIDWLTGQPAGGALFTAGMCSGEQTVTFRVRARAEQPEGSHGASPNHRYPGDWSAPAAVTFVQPVPCVPRAFLPLIAR